MLRTAAKLTNKRTKVGVYSTSWCFCKASSAIYIVAGFAKPASPYLDIVHSIQGHTDAGCNTLSSIRELQDHVNDLAAKSKEMRENMRPIASALGLVKGYAMKLAVPKEVINIAADLKLLHSIRSESSDLELRLFATAIRSYEYVLGNMLAERPHTIFPILSPSYAGTCTSALLAPLSAHLPYIYIPHLLEHRVSLNKSL
jgi:hypothetical protein